LTYSIDHNRLQQFGSLEFLARQVVEGFIVGLHQSPFHGFSVEFAEHRLYNAGESIKNIDWKLYGRTDKLFVKRFEEETNLRCFLVIDNSSSMYYPVREKPSLEQPNKITFSIYAAAALMNLMRRQRDAVGLNVFAEKIEFSSAAKSNSVHFKYLYSELEKMLVPIPVDIHRDTAATAALNQIAENIHKRSLVIIFSDMLDNEQNSELFNALQHLRYNKHEVLLFHVTDHQQEREFQFSNRPHRFIDLETGHVIRLNPWEIKHDYIKSVNEYFEALKIKCGQYQIDLAEADINLDFKHVLFSYLVKRKKLY